MRAALVVALAIAAACRGRSGPPEATPAPPPPARRAPVGVTTRDWEDAARGRPLATTIWYPAAAGTVEQTIWWDGIFPGTGAWNVPLRDGTGRLPVVLLSHGSGGDGSNLAWLAEGLVEGGYLAVAVDHPGDRFGDSSTPARLAAWRRPRDLSVVLTALLADPALGPYVDRARIAAAGHSSGGFTALALAGARFRPERLLAYCASRAAGPDCALVDGVDLRSLPDRGEASRSYRDRRVRAVVALAPVLGPGVTEASLRAVPIPVGIVASRTDELVPFARNAGRYARLVPGARLLTIADAGHFTFMPVCSDAGFLLARQVCVDRTPDVDRAAVHARTIAWAAAFFDRVLARVASRVAAPVVGPSLR